MANAEGMDGRTLQKFLSEWYRHPLSLSIVTILVTFTFLFMMLNNKMDNDNAIPLIICTFSFSFSTLLLIYIILCVRKEVLYNALELLTNTMNHQIQSIQEILDEVQIGIGGREETLERLCPKTAKKTIDDRTHSDIQTFESLSHIFKNCDNQIPNIQGVNLSLAKYYYKIGNFEKALYKISMLPQEPEVIKFLRPTKERIGCPTVSTNPGEIDFCRGLILKKLQRAEDGDKFLTRAKNAPHAGAACAVCENAKKSAESETFDENQIHEFIALAHKCLYSTNIEHCLNKLSSAFYAKAKILSVDKYERAENFQKALVILDKSIKMFDGWLPYYNRACNLCLMAHYKIALHPDKDFDTRELQTEIFICLERAFRQRPALARFSLEEGDLKWVKENHGKEFNELIGRTYINNFEVLT